MEDQKFFVKSLYNGKSEIEDEIALRGKLEEFDFVADSEEEDEEDLEQDEDD